MNKVEEEFKRKGVAQPGGWFVLSKNDAIAFVESCEREGIRIFGIDGFFRGKDISHSDLSDLKPDPDAIQPSMEHSIDFSDFPKQIPFLESKNPGVMNARNVYEASEAFLKEKDEKMFFEIVCEK